MNSTWLDRWNERYREAGYAYGTAPNDFLSQSLSTLPETGKILFPADGEGRNKVYAATLGWDAHAFDISEAGKKKALQLAQMHRVSLDYQVGELPTLGYEPSQFDAMALIYAHFPAAIKSDYHRRLTDLLKAGGYVIFEAFSKNHLPYRTQNPAVGGPTDLDNLFSVAELKADFKGFTFLDIREAEIELQEGRFHIGKGSVIRFVARKP